MKKFIKKIISAILGFFARVAVTFNKIFNKGNPADNPAGKGTGNEARPRRRLVDGIDPDRFTQLCAVFVVGFVSIIGAVLIAVSLNSGGHKISVDETTDGSSGTSGRFTLTIGGNIMPSQNMIDCALTDNGYNFSNYISELSEVMSGDISIAGLCGQIDANDSENIGGFGNGGNYPRSLADSMSEAGINYVFGANDHAFDHGYDGMCATVSNLHKSSIGLIGLTDTDPQKLNCSVTRVNGINVGLTGYNCINSNGYSALNSEQKTYSAQLNLNPDDIAEKISADITKLKSGGAEFIVVCINWGTRNDTTEADFMKKAAQKIAQAGADVIVGYGPYITMKPEIIEYQGDGASRECYVFYSLGCLFSDMTDAQDYSLAMSCSMTVSLEAARGKNGSVAVELASYSPIYMIKNSTQEDNQTYLKYMAVPAAKYVSAEEKPDIFTDNEQWQLCKNAFKRICELSDSTRGRLVLSEPEREDTESETDDIKI